MHLKMRLHKIGKSYLVQSDSERCCEMGMIINTFVFEVIAED